MALTDGTYTVRHTIRIAGTKYDTGDSVEGSVFDDDLQVQRYLKNGHIEAGTPSFPLQAAAKASPVGYVEGGTVVAEGSGSLAFGEVGGWALDDPNTDEFPKIKSGGFGTIAIGRALAAESGPTVEILSDGEGSIAMGYAYGYVPGATSRIDSGGGGSVAMGKATVFGSLDGTSEIISSGVGSLAFGSADSGDESVSRISAPSGGSLAGGSVVSYGNTQTSEIKAQGNGSIALGYAHGGYSVKADFATSVAIGSTKQGSYAGGYDEGDVIAGFTNSWQFGIGTNNERDSLAIGYGFRFSFRNQPVSSLRNGDFWLDGSGNVMVRTGGISKSMTAI